MHKTLRLIAITGCALCLGTALAGCGGGGSGNRTLNGLLLDADNTPLAGATVVYDKGTTSAQTAVTDTQGRYRFVVARDAITGSDTLTFTDAAGHLIDLMSVAIHTDTPSTSLTTIAPPDPPAQQL